MQVLIVEAEEVLRADLLKTMGDRGIEAYAFEEPLRALEICARSSVPIVISSICPSSMSGIEFLSRVKAIDPDIAVILLTALEEISNAVEAMRKGAFDYLIKPLDVNQLIVSLNRAVHLRQIREENLRLRRSLAGTSMIGESAVVSLLRNSIRTAASCDLPVLLSGETGTGKDLAARMIHETSARSGHPFVKISCSRCSSTVIEDELFGREAGTLQDAGREVKGKVLLAHEGTVYLDDVDDLTPDIQRRVLRLLDHKVIEPVGSLEATPVDVRIIASAKRDLAELAYQGRFQEDLCLRLSSYCIMLPPLRRYKEDIPLFVRSFWDRMGHPQKTLTEDGLRILEDYPWPGNVRELKNVVEMLAVSCRSHVVTGEDLPRRLTQEPGSYLTE